jgi:hypothetical protein
MTCPPACSCVLEFAVGRLQTIQQQVGGHGFREWRPVVSERRAAAVCRTIALGSVEGGIQDCRLLAVPILATVGFYVILQRPKLAAAPTLG